ncbi:hypothetical protein mRhiFer1_009187 [Rhinolophus ferrumequinum]|uniref:Transmembrane protein n=1 Tax=Rhinolophus ferrumequinum TaxID=59479 RepID=A0A7J7SJF6_RHIFE|nr:hypothetical protein mRhiFer1_009187 [Rhinolophus ferrumequinum]
MSPSPDPGTRLFGVWGSSTPKRHKADFNHFFPLNLILLQWSQHGGCFHTQQDKGRRLRHDTVPFQAEAGILDSLKNKKETRKTNNKYSNKQKKLTTTKIVYPFAHARGDLGICCSRRRLCGAIIIIIFFLASCWLVCYSTSFIINLKKHHSA